MRGMQKWIEGSTFRRTAGPVSSLRRNVSNISINTLFTKNRGEGEGTGMRTARHIQKKKKKMKGRKKLPLEFVFGITIIYV
jgi:hypothetical protein